MSIQSATALLGKPLVDVLDAVVVVCARGGSKRFLKKNIAPVNGQPMIGWAIKTAQLSLSVKMVAVSTDCPEIAEVSRSLGAKVIDRPKKLANDKAPLQDALRHAIAELAHDTRDEFSETPFPPFVFLVQANLPIWQPGTLDRMCNILRFSDADAVLTGHYVTEQPDWMQTLGPAGLEPYNNHSGAFRQQDLPPVIRLDGQAILLRTRDFMARKDIKGYLGYCGPRRMPFLRHWVYGLDVDEPADLPIVEAAMNYVRDGDKS